MERIAFISGGIFIYWSSIILTLAVISNLGVLVLYATNPAYAYQQALYYGVGLAAMVVCIYLVRIVKHWKLPVYLMMPVSLALLALPLLIGRETNGAKNWFYVGSLSVQSSSVTSWTRWAISTRTPSGVRTIPIPWWCCPWAKPSPGSIRAVSTASAPTCGS